MLTLIDISGLKAAEDALFHERYLLDSLMESVPDAIYFKDASGRFVRVNHAMAERLGVADPAACGRQDSSRLLGDGAASGASELGRCRGARAPAKRSVTRRSTSQMREARGPGA